ncbi:MAG TPA: phosphoadenosine phosphosulfate reductase family protein [Bacillales bacterium]|nr:phosphoadenosine phosphosulfate reductase family protein [Bacillales bacterium]
MTKVIYDNWFLISGKFPIDDHTKGALAVLDWAYSQYSDEKLVYASSFGAEAIVLIDLIYKINQNAQIVFWDTDLHFPETYDVIEQVESHYPSLNIERRKANLSLDEEAAEFGTALWKRDPNRCCQLRKANPLREEII